MFLQFVNSFTVVLFSFMYNIRFSLSSYLFFPPFCSTIKKKKISACSLPKLILNGHFCLSSEKPINIEVATFNPFCTNLVGNRVSVAMRALFPYDQ